jgi:RNA polymerase sigma factor (sigma-70 family)
VHSTDLELLRAYERDGDQSAFSQLVDRHTGWLFAAARRRLRDDHLADDAVQAVFVILASKSPQLLQSELDSFSAWLFHVLHFACSRIRRSQSRRAEHEQKHGTANARTDDPSIDDALLLLLEDSIAELPAIEREMIVRKFYRHESFAEIGATSNISADAARKRVSRALAEVKQLMLRDGVGVIPDEFLAGLAPSSPAPRTSRQVVDRHRIDSIAKGTVAMVEQAKTSEFPVVSAEFFVKDVEANLDFFEKLGFRRRWTETPDAMGRLPRASLVGGVGRIWLRRASDSDNTRPAPGVNLFFWIDGGPEALLAHRKQIADAGIPVSPFSDDHSLRNFTVTTPDGYSIGFFTQYQ